VRQTEQTIIVDCEQCLKEERVTGMAPLSSGIPDGWLEVTEGPPFHEAFQFCSPECFVAWHARDRTERLRAFNDRKRTVQEARLAPQS
jgi:hypothetical protein